MRRQDLRFPKPKGQTMTGTIESRKTRLSDKALAKRMKDVSWVVGLLPMIALTVGVLGGSAVQASTLDPAISTIAWDGYPYHLKAEGPQSVSASGHYGTMDFSETASTTAFPSANVSLSSGGCTTGPGGGCAGGYHSVYATLRYQIEVSGPAGQVVPCYFRTAGGVTIDDLDGAVCPTAMPL